jgi:hypothetical protein
MKKRWEMLSNTLILNGKKIGEAAKYIGYTPNGLRAAVNKNTIPYAKLAQLAEFGGIPMPQMMVMMDLVLSNVVSEPPIISKTQTPLAFADNPHDFVGLLFSDRELLSRLLERERELQNSSGTAPK